MRKWLKRIGVTLGVLVLVVLLAAGGLSALGASRLNDTFPEPSALAALPVATASAARGEHIMRIHGCQSCHGEDLGGKVFLDIPPGLIVAPNLTSGKGGVGAQYTEKDFDRAVRFGMRPSGGWLLPFMPYRLYNHLSDADAADLAAYLETMPAVDNEVPATQVRFPGYLMLGLPDFKPATLLHGLDTPRPAAPPAGPTPEYGKYLASTTCVECHGQKLEGGKHPAPEAPPAPGLLHTSLWSYDQFAAALRTGVVPGGRKLSVWMPYEHFAHLTDDEVRALYLHVGSLQAQAGAGQTASR